jgi:hypothetical protein
VKYTIETLLLLLPERGPLVGTQVIVMTHVTTTRVCGIFTYEMKVLLMRRVSIPSGAGFPLPLVGARMLSRDFQHQP